MGSFAVPLRKGNCLCPGRTDRIAALQLIEQKLFGVRRPGRWLDQHRAMIVVSLYHSEQVVGGILLVGQDETAHPLPVRRAMVEPAADVG